MSALLEKLNKLGPGDLPTPPSVALKIVHACSNPDITSTKLAEIVGSDTALLAELLRMVNSPFFGINQKISTANRAIVVLGTRSLRNLALCFTARESLRPQSLQGIDTTAYWAEVLRRSVSARVLAETVNADVDEAFTIGMLQDFGLLAMLLICPEHGKEWTRLQDHDPDERRFLEMNLFGVTHDAIGEVLAKNWGLPDQLVAPIANHHSDNIENLPPEIKKMSSIALCADWMAAVYTASDKRLARAKCHRLITDFFSLDESKIEELLEKVPGNVMEAAVALGININEQSSYDEVVTSANKRLIEKSINHTDQALRLEQALEARELLAKDLQKAYNHLAQLAYYDPLTTLVNRRRYEEVLLAEIGRHCRSGAPLSMVLIDVDHFKSINDKHGHAFGDAVLQALAKILKGNLRSSDIAARLGGDEVCLLLPETDVKGGKLAAERIQRQISTLTIEKDHIQAKMTASFGGCTWKLKSFDRDNLQTVMKSINIKNIMKDIVDSADKAMYKSKQGGRDTITWKTLDTD